VTKAWTPPTREEILEALRKADAPLTPRELAERMQVPTRHVDALEQRIAAMERDGQLLPNRKGVLLLASRLDLIAGRILGHRDGFGFLLPDAGGPDLFLSPREMQKAMHGDRALVKRIGFDSRGKPEGAIVEVTERGRRRLVGRFLNERGVTIVVPEDQRIKHDILIPPGDAAKAQPGQVVTVEIIEPPSGHAPPMGRVVEVLGEIDDPGMEIEIAVRKYDVPHVFSDAAFSETAKLPNQVRPSDLRQRIDLRDVPLVTIDGEDARDFDDAVYCEPLDGGSRRGGGWRLLVAIADVSHYVTPDSAIDADAIERSTSVYFPRRVIPMLPEKLSNGLCSLNPQVDRLVLVADVVVNARGQVRAYQFYEAVMHSAARLTYDEVWGILSGRDLLAIRQRTTLVPHLQHLYELYRTLVKARSERGAVDFETIETRIVCDPAGRIEKIVPRLRNDAHKLIEECMLAANTCAADFLQRSKHPGLFRIHEGPTPERLALLREFLQGLGLTLGGGDDPSPADYAALADQIRARPDASLLQTMLLRSMQQAIYSPYNVGHFGLSYEAYAHFTSPIRRYPDLVIHRVIKALLRGERYQPPAPSAAGEARAPVTNRPRRGAGPPSAKDQAKAAGKAAARTRMSAEQRDELDRWERLGLQCSANERRADEASRDVEAWLKCLYMRERVGEQFRGTITGVASFGIFVTLNDLFVEGMVHVSELGSEYYQYIEAAHELRGERTGRRFRLTDELDVQVSRVDLEARRIEFRMVKPEAARPEAARQQPRVPAAAEFGPALPAVDGGAAKGKRAARAKTPEVARKRAERLTAKRRGGLRSDPRGSKRKRRR
jgi:ribonuclease R